MFSISFSDYTVKNTKFNKYPIIFFTIVAFLEIFLLNRGIIDLNNHKFVLNNLSSNVYFPKGLSPVEPINFFYKIY